MTTSGGSAHPTAARSGGKLVSTYYRRRFNPYERPTPPPPPPPPPPSFSRSPLSSLIVPACRTIASGAVRILSSVFNSSSSSSSSSSDDEADSAFEDDANHEIHSNGVNESNLVKEFPSEEDEEPETSPKRMKCTSKEPGSSVEKNEKKHVIEQLLMQETFSREECNKFVKIIRSRVVEQSFTETGENVFLADTPWKTANSVTPDLCNKAVLEAKKWIKEKKAGQSPGLEFSHAVESEVGSPVDMAKSYMRARPLWASPSNEDIDVRTPSTMITQLPKEGKWYSVGGHSFSSSMKRSSLASGAWNIQDEIRKVHSKATEDMLQPSSSSKVDLSLFSLSPRTSQKYNLNELNSLVEIKPIDESAELAGASTNLVLSAMEIRQGVLKENLSNQLADVPQQKQDSEGFQSDGEHATPKSHHSAIPERAAEQYTDTNSGSRNGSTEMEVLEFIDTRNANGLPASQASFSAEIIMSENHRHATEENLSILSHGISINGLLKEDRCVLSTETSIEVPVAYETEGISGGYPNNYEELSQGQSQPEGKHDLAGKFDGNGLKQEAKKPTRNIRKFSRRVK